jgi:hypothetical protein
MMTNGGADMTSPAIKIFTCALGLALLVASAADAATKKKKAKPVAPEVTASAPASCRGASLFPCGPIYYAGQYLGEDPDPFIRSMINRDLGAKFGDPD